MTRPQVAQQLGISTKTLARWEQRGWLTPDRDWRGWRIYTTKDVEVARTRVGALAHIQRGGRNGAA